MINFVYTLCCSTPGQIQHGRFIRFGGGMIRDQVRIHCIYYFYDFDRLHREELLFVPR